MSVGPSRRGVLAGLAATSLLPARVRAKTVELVAAPGTAQLAPPDYAPTPVWSYGSVPGPEVRVVQGGRVRRTLVNGLSQPTSIHWHGIRIDNAMDGVPGLTQDAVQPGGRFDYYFVAPDAGTYWYHTHNRTFEQLGRGLYGPLIVDEASPPMVDADIVLMLDDWRLTDTAEIADDFGAIFDKAHGGRIGNWITVNGQGEWSRPVRAGDRLRLRLINAANARIFSLSLKGLSAWTVALDGQPLVAPEPAGRLVLGPAQRVDLIADVVAGDEALILSRERDGDFAIASLTVSGGTTAERGPPTPLPPNPAARLSTVPDAPTHSLRMEGGAMGRMAAAELGGVNRPIRDLAAEGKVWAFNGRADMPEDRMFTAARGTIQRIAMVNDTQWPHAMHLHGHHFQAILPGGALGPLRDTLLVDAGATAEIVLIADNPGDWLLHCHMAEHADAGMMTWFRVA